MIACDRRAPRGLRIHQQETRRILSAHRAEPIATDLLLEIVHGGEIIAARSLIALVRGEVALVECFEVVLDRRHGDRRQCEQDGSRHRKERRVQ